MATSNDKIYEILIDIQGRVCAIETMSPTVAALEKIVITGNGKLPLQERINNIESYVDKEKQKTQEVAKDKKDEGIWFKRLVLGGFVLQFIILGFSWFK